MIAESLLLLMAVNAAPADTAVAETDPPPSRLLRFVGEQVSFDPIDCVLYRPRIERTSQTPEQIAVSNQCGEGDLNFRVRYRVLQTIESELPETVEFLATGWTSHYAESRHALLYALDSPDGVVLPPGLAVSVFRGADGDWASCDDDIGSELLAFEHNLVFGRTDGMSPHGIAERFPASDYVVIGNEAFCIRGRRLPALAKDLDSEIGELRNQGYQYLPYRDQLKTQVGARLAE